jgi:glycosyltransferase involved in cell wall biosynthesis
MEPLISIIIAVLNGENTLCRCIDSVVHQTYPDRELIIIDGGSSDGTVEILKEYDGHIKYWESRPDRGIYHAWNKALDHVSGGWICFIGCDDFFFDNDVLSNIVPKLVDAKNKNRLYAYGKVALYSDNEKRVIEYYNDDWEKLKTKIRRGGFLVHSGSFHQKELFHDYYKFDERYKIAGDRDFLLRALKFTEAYYLENVIIGMSIRGVSFSLSDKKKLIDEVLSIWKKNQITTYPWLIYLSLIKFVCYNFISKFFGEKFGLRLANTLRKIRGENPYWHL